MEVKVKKWGNGFGIRIPKSFSSQAGITDGSVIEMQIKGDKIIIVPLHKKENTLDELLSKVSVENIHNEIKTNESHSKN